jgi:primosomal protein N''
MNKKALISLLEKTVNRLCRDCRDQIPFNMAGSHSFDRHARKCEALELRAAVKELKEERDG